MKLTLGQKKVLRCVVGAGMTYRRTAAVLGIGENTVKWHIHAIAATLSEYDPRLPARVRVERHFTAHPERYAA